jgi:hypothetical protein
MEEKVTLGSFCFQSYLIARMVPKPLSLLEVQRGKHKENRDESSQQEVS